jgi:spermidine/putrescine transport system permease protein
MKRKELAGLGYPSLIWFIVFLFIPLLIVCALSLFTRGMYGGIEWKFTASNYQRLIESVYLGIFFQSLKLSVLTAVICLVLAYPMAWAMSAAPGRWRGIFMAGLAVPFLMNLIIRVYAVKLFTGIDGPLQSALTFMGVPFDPFSISQNTILVFYGMVTTYLPFMVFPLYAAMEKFDFSLVEAAQDLGASQIRILFKVIIPNTRVAALSGFTLVFVPCLGEFVIPDLLGGAKSMLVGNLITEQFLKTRDWPFGAALSVMLIILLLGTPFLLRRIFLGKNHRSVELGDV